MEKKPAGVIVGRFQVHDLHRGHREILDRVTREHNKVVLFLGSASESGTSRNPLDYHTRAAMIQEHYPRIIILPISDVNDDQIWSETLDRKIQEVISGPVILYGSRDSFIPHYQGQYTTKELEPSSFTSGTDIRNTISDQVLQSKEFRAGQIYAVYGRYPVSYQTVDIAITRKHEDKIQILLGRKWNETKWRFPGGFVDPTDSGLEIAARREALEELGPIEISTPKYITSIRVDDWRYEKSTDKIMTALFHCEYLYGTPTPSDDIHEALWVDLDQFELGSEINKLMVHEHVPLMNKFVEYMNQNQ